MRSRLEAAGALEGGREEADLIFRHRLGLNPAQRLMHGRGGLGPRAVAAVEDVLRLREGGLPLAYALGRTDFGGLVFEVSPDVLIPRQDTEFLVQRGEIWLRQQRYPRGTLLDLGCGSGCVGLTLAWRFPELRVVLSDVSPAALTVARENARRLGLLEQCDFRHGDWFESIRRREKFDLVLCNPPYITRRDDPLLEASVRDHEPGIALFLESDPEEFFLRLSRSSARHLNSGGLFAVEVGYDTVWPARCAVDQVKQFKRGHEIHDFCGIERVIWALRK